MGEQTWRSDEQVHCDARIATAKRFGIRLWIVEVNEICYAKEVEWLCIYYEEDD